MEAYEKYYDMLWRISPIQMGNPQDAYDVTQETFLRLMAQNKAFLDEEHEKAWLIRTAVNYCRDIRKSSWYRKRISVSPEELFEKEEALYRLEATIESCGLFLVYPAGLYRIGRCGRYRLCGAG